MDNREPAANDGVPQERTAAARTWSEDYPERESQRRSGVLDFVEGVLIRVALIGLVLLVLGQTVVGEDITSIFMSYADRLSYELIDPQRPVVKDVFGKTDSSNAVVTLQLVSHPGAPELKLLRNGAPVGTFVDDQLTFTVDRGDLLQLDGSESEERFVVRVVLVAGAVTVPAEGVEFVVERGPTPVGKVR